jgi:predicted aspartyl protease
MSRNWLSFKRGNVPVVSVHIGVDRYSALVDTGALFSFIAPGLSLELGLQKSGTQAIVSVTGHREYLPKVTLPAVGFAEFDLSPCEAVVRNLTPLGLSVELILGVNAFAGRRLQFDFNEGRVYLLE